MKKGQSLIIVTAENGHLSNSYDLKDDLVFNRGELRNEIGDYSIILDCKNIVRPLSLQVSLVKIIMPEIIKYGVGVFWLGSNGEQLGEICLLSDKKGKKVLRNIFKRLTKN